MTGGIFAMVLLGAGAGLVSGMLLARSIAAILYQVRPADPAMLAVPVVTILAATQLSALPPVLRALRIDPVSMLRAE